MARYDYGLRGPVDTTDPRFRGWNRPRYGWEFEERRVPFPPGRVTARYNADYVREQGERYPANPYPYGGEYRDQIADESMYQRPYMTRGGTWTNRGAPRPERYDYRDFGPEFGGRYPDEI
jgi:hypothetical protein